MEDNFKIKDLLIPAVIIVLFLLFIGYISFILSDKLTVAERDINDLNTSNNILYNSLQTMTVQKINLEQNVNQLNNTVSSLTQETNAKSTQISSLNSQLSSLSTEKSALTTENLLLKIDINNKIDLIIDKNNMYNILKSGFNDVNNIAEDMYDDFIVCRQAINIFYNTSTILTDPLLINTADYNKVFECINTPQTDLNTYKRYFD